MQADADAIAEIRIASWQAAYDHVFPADALAGLTGSRDESAERWRSWLADPDTSQTVVAEIGGRVVGYANVGPARDAPEGCGELFMIYVAPSEWGHGAGRALMAAALRHLRQSGFQEAVLWVLEDNPRTRRFYELAGWHEDGGVKQEEWLGSLVSEVRYRIEL